MPGEQRFYSEEEAQQVLNLASRRASSIGMSREELVRAAAEMGISSEDIAQAESELESKRIQQAQAEETKQLRIEFNRAYRRRAFDKIWGFISGNLIFVFIWYISGGGYFWPIWVFGWWGIAMVGDILNAMFNATHKEKAFEKWMAKKKGILEPSESSQDQEVILRARLGRNHRYWRDGKDES